LAQLQAQRSAIASGSEPTFDIGLENRIAEMEADNQQSFLSKNKWWFIGGGVLLVGGIATFLILRNRK
jgi:hypothetical protein